MADIKQTVREDFEDVRFQQIAAAATRGDVEVYGLTAEGNVFLLDKDKAYWIPVLMRTVRVAA